MATDLRRLDPTATPTFLSAADDGATGSGGSALSPRKLNSKQWLERLLQEYWGAMKEQKGLSDGYFWNRMGAGDAWDDAADKWYTDYTRGQLIPEAERIGQRQFRFGQSDPGTPTFSFREGPTPEDYGSWAGRNAGLTGATGEVDLTRFTDPAFFLSLLEKNPFGQAILGPQIEGPDFDAKFREYMDAANSSLRRGLREGIDDLSGSAAGRGRLNTGFFDEDVGAFSRALAEQERETVGRGALDVLGLMQQDTDSQRRYAYDRGRNALEGLNFSLRAGETAKDAAFQQAANARANRGELRGLYENDRDFSESSFRDRRDFARAGFESERAFGEDRFRDRRDFAYDQFGDETDNLWRSNEARQGLANDYRRWAMLNSENRYNRWADQRGQYLDLLSGGTDRAQGLYNAREQRKSAFWNSLIQGAFQLPAAFA